MCRTRLNYCPLSQIDGARSSGYKQPDSLSPGLTTGHREKPGSARLFYLPSDKHARAPEGSITIAIRHVADLARSIHGERRDG
jgi:hypothetical protein